MIAVLVSVQSWGMCRYLSATVRPCSAFQWWFWGLEAYSCSQTQVQGDLWLWMELVWSTQIHCLSTKERKYEINLVMTKGMSGNTAPVCVSKVCVSRWAYKSTLRWWRWSAAVWWKVKMTPTSTSGRPLNCDLSTWTRPAWGLSCSSRAASAQVTVGRAELQI